MDFYVFQNDYIYNMYIRLSFCHKLRIVFFIQALSELVLESTRFLFIDDWYTSHIFSQFAYGNIRCIYLCLRRNMRKLNLSILKLYAALAILHIINDKGIRTPQQEMQNRNTRY